jgi:hypothetical protein
MMMCGKGRVKRGVAMTINADALVEHFEEEVHEQQELSAFLKAQ